MSQGVGVTGMTISLPGNGETLGLQFSVFGSCDAISRGPCTVTVAVKNGASTLDSKTAATNPLNGTYETYFSFPAGTNVAGASVVVSCSTMTGETTAGGLTLAAQSMLSITAPVPNAPEQVAKFPSWSASVVARGEVRGCAGKTMWLRLTDAGNDFIGHHRWTIGDSTDWTCDLSDLVRRAGKQGGKSSHYNVHVSVWESGVDREVVRVCSGFFTVGE